MDRANVSDEEKRRIASDLREMHGRIARRHEIPERFTVFARVDKIRGRVFGPVRHIQISQSERYRADARVVLRVLRELSGNAQSVQVGGRGV